MFEEEEGKPRKMVMVTVEGKEMMKAMVKKKWSRTRERRGEGLTQGKFFFLNENGKVFLYSHIIY